MMNANKHPLAGQISSRPGPARPRSGYTIVELLVVCTVIGIMMAIAVPGLSSRNARNRAEGAARDLSVRMQMARQKAVSTRMPYRMTFDATAKTYQFERYNADSTWSADPDEVFDIEGVHGFTSDVGGSAIDTEVRFETRGTLSSDDSPVRFLFISTNSDTASLSVVRTGRSIVKMSYN